MLPRRVILERNGVCMGMYERRSEKESCVYSDGERLMRKAVCPFMFRMQVERRGEDIDL